MAFVPAIATQGYLDGTATSRAAYFSPEGSASWAFGNSYRASVGGGLGTLDYNGVWSTAARRPVHVGLIHGLALAILFVPAENGLINSASIVEPFGGLLVDVPLSESGARLYVAGRAGAAFSLAESGESDPFPFAFATLGVKLPGKALASAPEVAGGCEWIGADASPMCRIGLGLALSLDR